MDNTNLSEKIKEALKQNIINFFDIKDEEGKKINNNICISGKWGSGKTTFIENFLKETEFSNFQIHIFPVWIYEITDNKFLYLLLDIIEKNVPEEIKDQTSFKETIKTIGNALLFSLPEKIEKTIENCKNKDTLEITKFKNSFDYLSKIKWFTNVLNSSTKKINTTQ